MFCKYCVLSGEYYITTNLHNRIEKIIKSYFCYKGYGPLVATNTSKHFLID